MPWPKIARRRLKLGVPAIYLHAGQEVEGKPEGWGRQQIEQWVEKHYHQPSDEFREDWDLSGAVQDAKLLFLATMAIAEADGHLHHYAANRETLIAGLRQLGVTRLAPADGAFYVYADVSDFTSDSLRFCERLLSETGLAIAPGIDFDTLRGNAAVRLSFAGPSGDIDEALRRLGPWLSR